jgi:hypothetical protein
VDDFAGGLSPRISPVSVSSRGHVVVGQGLDEVGRAAVGVWQLGVGGDASGAWIAGMAETCADPAAARRLLTCVEQRVVVAADPSTAVRTLDRIAAAAGLRLPADWWSTVMLDLPAMLEIVAEQRHRFEAAIEKLRRVKPNISALSWPSDLPDPLPSTFAGLRAAAGLVAPAGAAAVVREVLVVSRLVRWTAELWSQTEQAKRRREVLGEEFGEPEPLPGPWRLLLAEADRRVLPL